MAENIRQLPIGVQSFEKLRQGGYIYVDKTRYVYNLVHSAGQYFLSRPRRFGKSLFLSTLKAYWEGKRELFEGLAIVELEKDNSEAWEPYPVFCFDFRQVFRIACIGQAVHIDDPAGKACVSEGRRSGRTHAEKIADEVTADKTAAARHQYVL